jgi:hypothetical protein
MIPLIRRLLNYDTLDSIIGVAKEQQAVIEDQRRIIGFQQAEIQRLKIEYSRWGRDVIEQFLIALDRPEYEDDLRDRLIAAVEDMSDEVARLEEFSR